jgi:hypothetical protein
MEALGFPVGGWFGGSAAVYGAIRVAIDGIEKYGERVTVMELVGAGLLSERWGFLGAMAASAFLGAAIGSAAVASGRSLSCGSSLADVMEYAASKQFLTPDVRQVLIRNPQIFQRKHPARYSYAMMARSAR